MKAIITILLSILLFANAKGQESYIQKAQNYVDKQRYEKALRTLDKADPIKTEPFLNDFNLVKGLALAGLGDKDSALYYYEMVVHEKNLNDIPSRVLVDYSNSLFRAGDYNGALFFITRVRESLFGTKYPEGLEQIADKSQWAINNMDKFSTSIGRDSILDIRIGVHDLLVDVPSFGAAYFKDSLVFASFTEYKRPTSIEEEAFEHNEIIQDYYRTNTDLFIASLDDKLEDKRLFSEEIQTLSNEGALTFNKAGTKLYFTRHLVDKKGIDKYKIFYATKENGVWIDKGALNFNSDEFSCLQPSLSPDEETLYFVSNNAGGFGGYDIYLSRGDSTVWEVPKNLGPQINSAGDEVFPYLNDDSTMIYSSNGLMGFGGYDIYWVNMNDSEKEPYNLFQPINSNSDDYCIVGNRNKPEEMLFFSDRDMSFGSVAFGEEAEPQTLSFNIELLTPERRSLGFDYTLYLSKGESILKPVVENIKRKELEKQLAQNSSIVNGKIITTDDGHVILIDSISGELINVPGNIGVANGKVITNDAGNFVLIDSLSGNRIDVTKITTELIAETVTDLRRNELEKQLAENKDIENGKIITTDDGQVLLIDSVTGNLVDVPGNIAVATGKVVTNDDGKQVLVDRVTGQRIEADDIYKDLLTKINPEAKRDELEKQIAENKNIVNGKVITTNEGLVLLIDSVTGRVIDVPGNIAEANGVVVENDEGKLVLLDFNTGKAIDPTRIYSELIANSGQEENIDAEQNNENKNIFSDKTGAKLNSIFFNKNSFDLSDESKKSLEMIGTYLKAKPQMKLVISGHASMRGNHSYNLCISAHRAKQTYKFLTQTLNLPASSFILVANGKYFPLIKTFDVEEGMENRRVDLIADWTEPQTGIEVNFKVEKKYTDDFEAKLFRIFMKQNPEIDYLYMASDGSGIVTVAKKMKTTVAKIQSLNGMGSRDYLFKNEIIMVVPFKTPVKELTFKARVQDLLYIEKAVNIETIASKYEVSADEILDANDLNEDIIPQHTRLIIPLKENNK